MSIPYSKKLIPLIFLLTSSFTLFAAGAKTDSLILTEQEQTKIRPTNLDSLQNELDVTIDDSLKATLYTQIAAEYLSHDTVSNKKERHLYQNEAIKNTLSALHYYSRYDDTTGMRISFDILSKVYRAQHKYPQAKWFILQSNTLSRAKNDNPNVIVSLLELSAIKTDIKDYTLAMRDLNEALMISSKNHYPQQESEVQLHYALLYNVMKNHTKADIALKRHNAIEDSIRKAEEARLMAKMNTKDSLQQVKKKFYTISNKKLYKTASLKRIASL
jgi:tetratricopeptide (TPR) repeat protein